MSQPSGRASTERDRVEISNNDRIRTYQQLYRTRSERVKQFGPLEPLEPSLQAAVGVQPFRRLSLEYSLETAVRRLPDFAPPKRRAKPNATQPERLYSNNG
jgi:hypothetical protein